MSLYQVNLACRQVIRDPSYRALLKADPARALATFRLTDNERTALINGDVEALHAMGANNFLMGYLARYEVCGLNPQNYNARMRALAPHVPEPSR
jgi:hypothetical protein